MSEAGSILDRIEGPGDVRQLDIAQLEQLAGEIRRRIQDVVTRTGGHLASNLGVVELTLALHCIYDFEYDRLFWDVGHQCYTHKLITGRRQAFEGLRTAEGLSGFPNPAESPFDCFTVGHAGTAISTALGVVCAEDAMRRLDPSLRARPPRRAVVVVGDASIATGMSFEALNHAGFLGKRLLVILNDNRMAIASTVGALSRYLNKVRMAGVYNEIKRDVRDFLDAVPVVGHGMERILEHLKDLVRRSLVAGRVFEDLGFRYFGPTDGHDLPALLEALREIERLNIDGPVLLHVVTEKGRGHTPASDDPRKFHGVNPAIKVSNGKVETYETPEPTYTDVFAEELTRAGQDDPRIVALTAAMPDGTGLVQFASRFPDRCYDTGICEQHAVGMAAGMAAGGLRPVAAIYSTFLQRAYDQVFQEICLQGLPVLLTLDRAGLVGSDGPTHHGAYDIAYLRALPGITLMAPSGPEELRMMVRFALASGGPAAIRYPRADVDEVTWPGPEPLAMGKAQLLRQGKDATIIAYGTMVGAAWRASQSLANEGIEVTVVNARFARPLDRELFLRVVGETPATITVEEGSVNGGFGEAVLELASEANLAGRVRVLGIPDRFVPHGSRTKLLAELGLDEMGLVSAVKGKLAAMGSRH